MSQCVPCCSGQKRGGEKGLDHLSQTVLDGPKSAARRSNEKHYTYFVEALRLRCWRAILAFTACTVSLTVPRAGRTA
eukprot:4330140-Amphidinium_carterae.2